MKKFTLLFCILAITVALQAQIIHVPADYPRIFKGINWNTDFEPVLPVPVTNIGIKKLGVQSIVSASPYLDSIIQSKMETWHIPGLSACIVKNGEIQWTGAYGWAEIESATPVDTSTLFQIASTSKTITLTALMQIWENNRFNLDDDINDYLPWQVRNPGFPSNPITFRQLLTHTSTIRDNWNAMPYFWGMDCPIPLDQYLFDYLNPAGSLYNQYQNFFRIHEPGTYYAYSNIGVALAGLLVEEISGMPFYQFCQDSIFNPLGMAETSWFLSGIDTTQMARPYLWNGSEYIPYPFYSYPDYPDGALKTSVIHLAQFLMCYLGNGTYNNQVILNPATIDTILTIQLPELSVFQGLIWHKRNIGGIGEAWGHNGGDYGFSTEMTFSELHDIGVITCTNVSLDSADIRTIGNLLLQYALDSILTTTVPLVKNEFSKDFHNSPNPFEESTSFIYTLDESSHVILQVFENFGRLIAEPINAIQQKGEQRVEWNAGSLPAGIYYCRLQAGARVTTNKLVKIE
jgi:CubicO group peptidase (beta-lactamase class C family)